MPHTAARLLEVIAPELSDREYRPLKQVYLAHVLGTVQQQISRSLNILVARGIIERGENAGPSGTYRIVVHQ